MADFDNLPKLDNDTVTEIKETPDCKHFFLRSKSTEATCSKCNMGFFLNPGDYVKKGHVYRKELVI